MRRQFRLLPADVFIGLDGASLLPPLHQLHDKADARIKPLRRRVARGPRFNNAYNPLTKIFRIRSCHPSLAFFNPAHSLNHLSRPLGIPFPSMPSVPDPLYGPSPGRSSQFTLTMPAAPIRTGWGSAAPAAGHLGRHQNWPKRLRRYQPPVCGTSPVSRSHSPTALSA